MTDEAGARSAVLLDRQLDAWIVALLAVVEHGNDPIDLRALGIIRRMVVDAVISKLFHR
ncbi:MAG: hypothetical protein ACLPVY_20440 [Acidimicrobiia bacterium]